MTARRLVIGIVAIVVGLNVLEWALNGLSGGTPGGPTASSYATGSDGTAAWAELLLRNGHAVARIRVTPGKASLPPGTTAVVLDPPFVLSSDVSALDRFVRSGGRLIAGGTDVTWLRPIVGDRLESSTIGVPTAVPLAPVPEVAGVSRVETAAQGSWTRLGAALPVLGRGRRAVAAVAAVGKGRVVLLADDSMLQNAYLGSADNARFGLNIAGRPRRPVAFFESYHGYGAASGSGFSALPVRWQWLILLGFAAVGVYMIARARRLGPPEREERGFDPPRREYVEAMGGILARTRDPAEALQPLGEELRRRLSGHAGTAPAGTDEPAAAAQARGLTAEEAAAVARVSLTDEDVLPLGRALVKLGGAQGRRTWEN